MEVVDNQLRDNDPPETRQTLERLKRQGIDEAEARRLIACVIATEIFDIVKKNQVFDLGRFVSRLAALPDTAFLDE
jgi:hypothetical protein